MLLIIPLYKSPHLIKQISHNLLSHASEIRSQRGRVLFINDSPEDQEVANELELQLPKLRSQLNVECIKNERNIGFVKSTNLGLEKAISSRSDALLLNSDALLTASALTELREVAYLDPLISAVSPRSNNATICNSPYADRFRTDDFDLAVRYHDSIKPFLQRYSYVPTTVGFCMLIKYNVLVEFGLFDEIYATGYNEENDFLMRCNRRGYRSVLANHAFVFHQGSISFDKTDGGKAPKEEKNRRILLERYPEYHPAILRYFRSSAFNSELLLGGLVPMDGDRLVIHFDCQNLGAYHAGTFEYTIQLLKAFSRLFSKRYDIYVSCNYAAYGFHDLSSLENINFLFDEIPPHGSCAVSLRLAQPFSIDQVTKLASNAPISGFLMLDTIALDCLYLDKDDLEPVWRQMLDLVNLIGYISDFSRQQFNHRFQVPSYVEQFVSLCSTDTADYREDVDYACEITKTILVVGNHFYHKNVEEAVKYLLEFSGDHRVVVLGASLEDGPRLKSHKSGDLDQDFVDDLYRKAAVVVFPSYYEGFGLPIMHALARRRPVVCRNLPVFNEIIERSPYGKNIHLVENTYEIAKTAIEFPSWHNCDPDVKSKVQTWENAAVELEAAIASAISNFDVSAYRRRFNALESWDKFFEAQNTIRDFKFTDDRIGTSSVGSMDAEVEGERFNVRTRTSREVSFSGMLDSLVNSDFIWNNMPLARQIYISRRSGVVSNPAADNNIEFIQLKKRSDIEKLADSDALAIDALFALDSKSIKQIAADLLKLNRKIRPDGQLYLKISRHGRKTNIPLDPSTRRGMDLLARNSGFKLMEISIEGAYTSFQLIKRRDWLKQEWLECDAGHYISTLYSVAFGRRPDASAEDWKKLAVNENERIGIAQKIFSSSERLNLLSRM